MTRPATVVDDEAVCGIAVFVIDRNGSDADAAAVVHDRRAFEFMRVIRQIRCRAAGLRASFDIVGKN